MGISIEGQVGPRYVGDGAEVEVRQNRSGALVTVDAHGRFFEPADRGVMNQSAGAIAATTPTLSWIDPTDGEIVLPPGSIATLAPPAAGTTHVVAASIVWLEVPYV